MPTAVERLLFLKLALVDDFADFIGAHEHKIDNAFLNIDSDFLKLSSATGENFLKIEHDPALKHDFQVIGDAFHKIGQQFEVASILGDVFGNHDLKIAPNGLSDANTDFLKIDAALKFSGQDLKILGSDFLKLDTSPNAESFQLKIKGVGEDFLKLEGDMTADGAAFLKLGADFLKLGGGNENPSPLDLAYKELGGDLQTVGARFDALAADFLKIDEALGGRESSDFGGSVGTALMALNQDFLKLDTALSAVGGEAFKIFVGDFSQKVNLG
jgi:hypothetical protein